MGRRHIVSVEPLGDRPQGTLRPLARTRSDAEGEEGDEELVDGEWQEGCFVEETQEHEVEGARETRGQTGNSHAPQPCWTERRNVVGWVTPRRPTAPSSLRLC